ncbi:transposase [Kitasatospora sp. MAP12-15]|uniref:IS110 family transposase n=1 Tax=unclassified Kitasatospora TaxID=2633591 RepID=UPI00247439B5|nr:IS110 family transposase [Kitasatospora sp. MAP12-44]MDH6108713.1 transposase [Kitasatospora sp. MAP12-44]
MDVLEERCGGADLSKADVKVCIRVPGTGKRARYEVRTFSTMNDGLLELRDWLVENRVTRLGMEATASYWKPLFYLLEATEGIEPWLLNAQHIKTVPGRKTDVKDCQWICRLVEYGLVRPSFVPPRDIRQLRDLTRYRTETVRDRARDVNRLAMFLEDTGIKLSSVVSDITGRSARAMLDALVAGERDPHVLADLALGKLQGKVPLLTRALTGSFSGHHAFMVAAMLRAIDEADDRIIRLSEEINRQLRPLRQQVDLLITIPGISLTLAQVLIAEVGVDMGRFATAGHLASWAGMCPGNKESAGKRLSGRTRHGDTWLKTALFMAGASAARSKSTYLGAQFRRLVPHRGAKRATLAVGHSILVATWHILHDLVPYRDLGPDHFTNRLGKERQTRRLLAQLTALGLNVTVTPHEEAV